MSEGSNLIKRETPTKVVSLACNSIEKGTPTQVFSCEFCEIFKNTVFYKAPSCSIKIKEQPQYKI